MELTMLLWKNTKFDLYFFLSLGTYLEYISDRFSN